MARHNLTRPAWRYLALALAVLLIALAAWNWSRQQARAVAGAAYAARTVCSCRYVEGRSLDSCKEDGGPHQWMVRVSDAPEDKAVRAHVPFMAEARALYRQGYGCLMASD